MKATLNFVKEFSFRKGVSYKKVLLGRKVGKMAKKKNFRN